MRATAVASRNEYPPNSSSGFKDLMSYSAERRMRQESSEDRLSSGRSSSDRVVCRASGHVSSLSGNDSPRRGDLGVQVRLLLWVDGLRYGLSYGGFFGEAA